MTPQRESHAAAPGADHAAGRRDHRRLGRELGLFASAELTGAGLPLWLPDGAVVREQLEQFALELEHAAGYHRVYSPVLGKRQLYERSGHWHHFAEGMYPPMDVGDEQVVLRPGNCPHHALIYAAEHRSFRDLPLRLSELGGMFRMERSGVLGGLSRVRAMTLNDAHIFAPDDAVLPELAGVFDLLRRAYAVLGIDDHWLRLSLRGPGGKYIDDPVLWERSERVLREALTAAGVPWEDGPGEAAFYGPKVDVQIRDARGREETLSTVQVDHHLPAAFDLIYQDASGARQRPVMIHRSIISTVERMVAHLIERYDGAFPVWLAPVQVLVLPVAAAHSAAAEQLVRQALDRGVRARVHPPSASLGARIRRAQERRVPFMAVIGDREMADGTVALRRRDGVAVPALEAGRAVAAVADLARRRAAGLDLPAAPADQQAATADLPAVTAGERAATADQAVATR